MGVGRSKYSLVWGPGSGFGILALWTIIHLRKPGSHCLPSAGVQNLHVLEWTMTAHYSGAVAWNTIERSQRNMVAEPVRIPPYGNEDKARPINALYPNNCGGFEHRMFSENPNKQQVDMIAEPINTFNDEGEKARTMMAGYYKYGTATLVTNEGFKGGTTAVAEPVNTTDDGKSQTIKAQYHKNSVSNFCCYSSTYGASGVAEPIRVGTYPNNAKNQQKHDSQQYRIYGIEGKGVTLCGNGGGMGAKTGLYAIPVEFENGIPKKAISYADGKTYDVYEVKDGQITIKGKQYPIKLADGFYIIRKLTVRECMRLQTVPEWYDFSVVSRSQSYKMLGNGWTVSVITHLLQGLISNKTEDTLGYEQLEL